jgi:HprK-related kinase A
MILQSGPFTVSIDTNIPDFASALRSLYDPAAFPAEAEFSDFHIAVRGSVGPRRWVRPQVIVSVDGDAPFKPLPRDQAVPCFEWALNWAIERHYHRFLIIHAAVIERNGRAALLPGLPGAGKSTLAAGLASRGWRLLSDEMALITFPNADLVGLARPISLKNESIAVMRQFAPDAVIASEVSDTVKGTVALMKAPGDSIARLAEPARPSWVIFPKYMNSLPAELHRRSKASAFINLGQQSFNYSIHGAAGFELLADLVEACDCYDFFYGDLNEAIEVFDALKPPRSS